MADPTLAVKDPATVLAEALGLYKQKTGVTLAPADPRRLHLETVLLLFAQQRQGIDFAGKQSLLRFVSDQWIELLAELWGLTKLPAKPSKCTERFNFATVALRTIPDGTRVTDSKNIWRVVGDTTSNADNVNCAVVCIVDGGATNGVAIGQIDTLVDPDLVPGCTGVSNTTATDEGRDIEGIEDFRTRLRAAPESRSTCGPRNAYEAAALEFSPTVADAVALGPEDGDDMDGAAPSPGQVFMVIIEGERDTKGVLTSVVPEPDPGLLGDVFAALSPEDVRPLTDQLFTQAPEWVDFDSIATFYIARSRAESAASIRVAVQDANDAYLLWQQSKIGRDINPSEQIARAVNAGAKRLTVTQPAFQTLKRDQSARCTYQVLVFGGVEDD